MGTRQCSVAQWVGWPPLSIFSSHWDTQRRLCYGGSGVSAPLVSSFHMSQEHLSIYHFYVSVTLDILGFERLEGHSKGRVSYRAHSLLAPLGLWSREIWDWTSIFLKGLLAGNVKKSFYLLVTQKIEQKKKKNKSYDNTLILVMKMKSQNLASKWRN